MLGVFALRHVLFDIDLAQIINVDFGFSYRVHSS